MYMLFFFTQEISSNQIKCNLTKDINLKEYWQTIQIIENTVDAYWAKKDKIQVRKSKSLSLSSGLKRGIKVVANPNLSHHDCLNI